MGCAREPAGGKGGAEVYHCGLGSTTNLPRFAEAFALGTGMVGADLPSSILDVEATLVLPFCVCFLVCDAFGSTFPWGKSDTFGISCFPFFSLVFAFFTAGGTTSAEPWDNLSSERNEETSFTRAG